MIYELVKRDPAWKAAPMLAGVAALLAAVVGLETALYMLPLLFFMAANHVWPHHRSIPILGALPIAGRDLFLARAASLLWMVWLQVAAAMAGSMLTHGRMAPAQALGAPAFGLFFTFVVAVTLTMKVEQCGGWSNWIFWLWALAMGVAFAVGAGVWWAAGIAAFGAIGSAARFRWAWHKIPPAFQSAPFEAVAEKADARARGPAWAFRPLLRSMFSWFYVFFAVIGIVVCVLTQPLFLPALLMAAYGVTRRRLRWLSGAGLPISPRVQMSLMLLPLLLWVTLSYVPLALFELPEDSMRGPQISSAQYWDYAGSGDPKDAGAAPNLAMPLEYWKVAPRGHAPKIRAPWGESTQPTDLRLLGFSIYNPYSADRQNSPRFLEWQFARATAVVFGRAMPISQYEAVRIGIWTPLEAQAGAKILEWGLLLGFTILLVWLFEMADARPFRRIKRVVFESSLLALLLFPALSADVYGIKQGYGSFSGPLLRLVLRWAAGVLPGTGAAVAVAMLLVALPLWLLARRFPKREIVGPVRQENGWDY
jgi:hypothetical protein